MFIENPIKNMGQKPNEKCFTVALYFKVTPQMGPLISGQNETNDMNRFEIFWPFLAVKE